MNIPLLLALVVLGSTMHAASLLPKSMLPGYTMLHLPVAFSSSAPIANFKYHQSHTRKQRSKLYTPKRSQKKKKKGSFRLSVKSRVPKAASLIRTAKVIYDSLLVPGIIYRRLEVILADSSRTTVHTVTCVVRQPQYNIEVVQARDRLGRLETLPALVQRLDTAYSKDVLVAINGSFWQAGTHIPLGVTVSSGEIVANQVVPWHVCWLDRRYRPWIDTARLEVSVRLSTGKVFPIESVNRTIGAGITLFNRFAGDTIPLRTIADTAGILSAQFAIAGDTLDKPLSIDSMLDRQRRSWKEWSQLQRQGKLLLRYLRAPLINQEIPCIILAKVDSGTVDIPLRGCVISYPQGHILGSSVNVGDTLYLYARSLRYDSLEFHFGITGTPLLIQRGQIVPYLQDTTRRKSAFVEQRLARTAIGTDIIQSVLYLVVVEAFPPHSAGMTLRELAQFMKGFGAYNALNLDGGGSSTLVVGRRCVAPSVEILQRPIANAIVIWQRRIRHR